MTPDRGAERLDQLARGWRLRRLALLSARVLGLCLPVLALGWAGGTSWSRGLSWMTLTAGLAIIVALWRRESPRSVIASVARHLNRTVPEVQESAELLLRSESELPLLARLQRRRVDEALAGLPERDLLPEETRMFVIDSVSYSIEIVPQQIGGYDRDDWPH